jgi:KDO2-lipid IV(A) lauroyltransferase
MKKIRYACEAALVAVMLWFFKCLSPKRASNLGGMIARSIGPLLAVNRRAKKHLKLALPGKSEEEYADIIRGMWDNLGRVFAEYPHLEQIASTCVEFAGMEHFTKKSPAILIAGHIANWEIAATSFYARGVPIDLIYRAPNNPAVDRMLKNYRSLQGKIHTYPKSKTGMRQVISALGQGHNLGILIDQKYNPGIPAEFFGQTAMTSPVFVQLAQKYNRPVYPVRVERLQGCNFRVTCFPPLDTGQATETAITEAHSLLEGWISERPDQWIWLHRRWKI